MSIAMGKHTADKLTEIEALSGFALARLAGLTAIPDSGTSAGALFLRGLRDEFVIDFCNGNFAGQDDAFTVADNNCNENNGTHVVWEIWTDLALYTETPELEDAANATMTDRAVSIMREVAERLLMALWNDLSKAMDADDAEGE